MARKIKPHHDLRNSREPYRVDRGTNVYPTPRKQAPKSSPTSELTSAELAKITVMLEHDPARFKLWLQQWQKAHPREKLRLTRQWLVLRDMDFSVFVPEDFECVDFRDVKLAAAKLPSEEMRDMLLFKGAEFRGEYTISGVSESLYTIRGIDSYHWGRAAQNADTLRTKLNGWREANPGKVLNLSIMFPRGADLMGLSDSDFARVRLAETAFDDAIMTPEMRVFFDQKGAKIFENQQLVNSPRYYDPVREQEDFGKKIQSVVRF